MIELHIEPAKSEPTIIYDNELWRLTMEESEKVVVLHCEVYSWSKESYKEMIEQWLDFEEKEQRAIYCWCPDEKVFRFALMFGMKFIDMVHNMTDDSLGYLVKWEK